MKNIILCADGTGNRGGYGDDSNVYKLYRAINLRSHEDRTDPLEQISFYDNGVGTQDSSVIRGLSGAFGFGFKSNVRDLYEFLARNYDPGNRIYVFGFSRGAATARAFCGMIQWCGLLDRKNYGKAGGLFDEKRFQEDIDRAIKYYEEGALADVPAGEYDPYRDQSGRKKWQDGPIHAHGTVKIHFLGIWDTVSALGFPRNFSPAWSRWFTKFFDYVEWVSNRLLPHQFYDYQPYEVVENVCHALAIDDQRTTFHPVIWDEYPVSGKDPNKLPRVEQVWFPGVHSNVGGGYPRSGLSDVALEWMMDRAVEAKLRFIPGKMEEVHYRANEQGELFDSRAGLGVFYRYGPRDINKLCQSPSSIPLVAGGSIKMHRSVIERMKRATDDYAPRFLPDQFQLIGTKDANPSPTHSVCKFAASTWMDLNKKLNKLVLVQQKLYRAFIETVLLVLLIGGLSWPYPSKEDQAGHGLYYDVMSYVNEILSYSIPGFVEDLLYYATITQPSVFWLFLLYMVVVFYFPRRTLRKRVQYVSEEKRAIFLQACNADDRKATASEDQHREIGNKRWYSRMADGIGDFLVDSLGSVLQRLGNMLSWLILAVLLLLVTGWLIPTPSSPCTKEGLAPSTAATSEWQDVEAKVDAAAVWNKTDAHLTAEKKYVVSLVKVENSEPKDKSCKKADKNPKDTLWFDCTQSATDRGWHHPSLISILSRNLARNSDQDLFQLMGAVYGDCEKSTCGRHFPVRLDRPFIAPADGQFYLYANDVAFKYKNNSGIVHVKISRVKYH